MSTTENGTLSNFSFSSSFTEKSFAKELRRCPHQIVRNALASCYPNYDALVTERQEKIPRVEFKTRKIIFKQKPISFDKHLETLQGKLS